MPHLIRPDYIVLHHTVVEPSEQLDLKRINQMHVARGFCTYWVPFFG